MKVYDVPVPNSNGHARAVFDPNAVPLIKGRPSKAAEDRRRTSSWGYGGMLPRTTYRDYKIREGTTVFDTLRTLRDRDPDAGQAVNTLLLLCLQGYEVTAELEDGVLDDDGTVLLRDFDARCGTEYGGGADQLLGVYLLSLVTDGALAGELELDSDLRTIIDAHPIKPSTLTFQREEITDRLRLGIGGGKGFVELSPRQVRYVPYQPDVGDPYGRPMLLAAIAPIFKKIEFLNDLADVVHIQAWPRKDIQVIEQAILATLPPGTLGTQQQEYVQAAFATIQEQLLAADPTQDLVHLDSVVINPLLTAAGLPDLTSIMNTLDSQIVTGLKTLNVFLNRNAGSTTTHATVQARVFALEVAAIQRTIKRYWEWVGTTLLQLAGRQSSAHVEFELLQTTDRMIDANARATETATWISQVAQGWADDTEAANDLLGHDPVAEPEPEPEPVIEPEPEPDTDEPPPDDATDDEQPQPRWYITTGSGAAYPYKTTASIRAAGDEDDDGELDADVLAEAAALFEKYREGDE